jgi:hypothetical protein
VVDRLDLVQARYEGSDEWTQVRSVADGLVARLESIDAIQVFAEANRPGNSSALVQAVFVAEAEELGFRSKAKGLFAAYQSALRPDYFLPIGDCGVILEVERGKTTINNMDLLDFCKCHICEHANHLFLAVPSELRQNLTMSPRREFATVAHRFQRMEDPALDAAEPLLIAHAACMPVRFSEAGYGSLSDPAHTFGAPSPAEPSMLKKARCDQSGRSGR